MATLLHDLRMALRQLVRRPGFTVTAVLTLAIGMGVNTVAFTVVNAALQGGGDQPTPRRRPRGHDAGWR